MLTLKADFSSTTHTRNSGGGSSIMGMFTDPPDTFELMPNEFDIDAEITPDVQLHYKEAFLLKAREDEGEHVQKETVVKHDPKYDRLSVLEMQADPTKGVPTLAVSSSFGFGPTFALPTLQSFPQENCEGTVPITDGTVPPQTSNLDTSLISFPGFTSPERNSQENPSSDPPLGDSETTDTGNPLEMPPSIAGVFNLGSQNVPENPSENPLQNPTLPQGQTGSTPPKGSIKGDPPKVDLSPFQIPSSDESENEDPHKQVHPVPPPVKPKPGFPDLNKQPRSSAMKKPSISSGQVSWRIYDSTRSWLVHTPGQYTLLVSTHSWLVHTPG